MFLWFWVKSFLNCIFLIWKKNIFDWMYLIGLKPLSEESDPLRFIQSLLGPYNSSKGKSTNCAWSWLAKWCASRQKDSSDVFATTFVWRKKCILERASNHYTVGYSAMAITFNSEAILRLFLHTYTWIHKIYMFFAWFPRLVSRI